MCRLKLCVLSPTLWGSSESWNIDADRRSNFFEPNHPPFTFWTRWLMHTKQNSPVFSCDLNSHTGTVSLLSNTFQLTHTAADFAVSLLPSEYWGQVSHTDTFRLLYRRKINLPHLLLKSLWFQLCQSWDSFWSCRTISDIVWPKHKLVVSEHCQYFWVTKFQSFSLVSFFFFFFSETSLSALITVMVGQKTHGSAAPHSLQQHN